MQESFDGEEEELPPNQFSRLKPSLPDEKLVSPPVESAYAPRRLRARSARIISPKTISETTLTAMKKPVIALMASLEI